MATMSRITHAAMMPPSGGWFDASESRGSFGRMWVEDYFGRRCYVVDVPDSSGDWLHQLAGKKYDYHGVAGWLGCRAAGWLPDGLRRRLGILCGSSQRFYCFEAAWVAMTGNVPDRAVSGLDLLELAAQRGWVVRYGRFGETVR